MDTWKGCVAVAFVFATVACTDMPTAHENHSVAPSTNVPETPSSGQSGREGGMSFYAGRAADSVLGRLAEEWLRRGDSRLSDMLHRVNDDAGRVLDSARNQSRKSASAAPNNLVTDGGGGSGGGVNVTFTASNTTPEVLAHQTTITVGDKQAVILATATYHGTDIDISQTTESTNGRDGSTPNPSRTATTHLVGSALETCILMAGLSSSCNLVQTDKATVLLDLPLPCSQTVFGNSSYQAHVFLSASIGGGISIPVTLNTPSPTVMDMQQSSKSSDCVPPTASLRMESPSSSGVTGGTIRDLAGTNGVIGVGLWSTSTQGSTPITAYRWSVNGSTVSTEQGFTYNASVGTWPVSLVVTDAAGLSSGATGTIVISNGSSSDPTQPSGTDGGPGEAPEPPIFSDPNPQPPDPTSPPTTGGGSWWCQTTYTYDYTGLVSTRTDCYQT